MPESIVNAILSQSPSPETLSETQHRLALEYLAIQLAIRDREQLIKVLCHRQPDLLTSSIRTLVGAYEPIIRALHQAYDLSSGVSDLETFMTDFIDISKVETKNGHSKAPSVEDYVRLLHKHQGSSHRFIHQVLKNGKELSQWYHEYAVHASKQYRQESATSGNHGKTGSASAGDFTAHLEMLVSALSGNDKSQVLNEIDKHAEYLSSLTETSTQSMKIVVSHISQDQSQTFIGPGMYLSRWQTLMDEAPITPATPEGPLRHGKYNSVKDATRVDTNGAKKGTAKAGAQEGKDPQLTPPDVGNTVRLLIPGFRDTLRRLAPK